VSTNTRGRRTVRVALVTGAWIRLPSIAPRARKWPIDAAVAEQSLSCKNSYRMANTNWDAYTLG
jgi:hypothetical protein